MINFHLNGDIVRCPDMKEIHRRAQEIRDKNRICKYGHLEDSCETWQNKFKCGRCTLAGSDECPGHNKRVWDGLKSKHYRIDSRVYRKVTSTAHYLIHESNYKTLFITLTFPKFKRKVKDNEINEYFSRFAENLRANKKYNCNGYIAVRENGAKYGRVHFHLLASMRFVPFIELNNTWCNTISDICEYSRNAVTSDPKTRIIRTTKYIKNAPRALKYICKYISKCRNQDSKTRLVFISNNILMKPVPVIGSIRNLLKGYDLKVNHFDFCTCYKLVNNYEFGKFCREFLYPLFELTDKPPPALYSFPTKPG